MTDNQLVFRTGGEVEIGELLEFWARSGENHNRPTDTEELVKQLVDKDPESLIIAELDRRIVGTIIAGWDGWRANLYRLAVDPEYRGRGIARLLLERAETRLRDLGATRFHAMVLSQNDEGIAAWAAMGYHPQDEWTRWVKPA